MIVFMSCLDPFVSQNGLLNTKYGLRYDYQNRDFESIGPFNNPGYIRG